jgi:TolB-like protein
VSSALLIAAALLVVVGATVAGVTMLNRKPANAVAAAPSGRPSLAVLTFENRTGDAALDWYGRGAAELLGVELARLPNVDVISRQHLYDVLGQLKARTPATALDASVATEVARRSGATYMVRGDVIRLAGSVILTAEVVDVRSGRVIGAERVTGVDEKNMLGKVEELGALLRNRLEEVKS